MKVASALYFIHQEQNKNNSTSVRKKVLDLSQKV